MFQIPGYRLLSKCQSELRFLIKITLSGNSNKIFVLWRLFVAISIFNSPFRIPNSPTLFAYNLIDHGLCVGGRIGAGTVAANMGGGLAFYDLQAIGVPGKFSQAFGIGA